MILAVVGVLFAILSGVALAEHGFWGIIAPHFRSTGAGQVFADLVIALSLNLLWIARDARETGRRFWPWVGVTLATGSFGPLLYLLLEDRATGRRAPHGRTERVATT
jgi:hypothetical protein